MEKANHYEDLCRQWAEQFLRMDRRELRRRLPELREEDGALTLVHFGRKLAIDGETGRIRDPADGTPVSRDEQLNVYTLLGYCREDARRTGRWVPFRDVPGASPFAPAFDRGVLQPLAATFSGRLPALRRAAARLGGVPVPHGDAGFLLHAFECIPMQLLFWDGDDEFPAQANLLFDAGVTGFIHVESTVTLASVALSRLAQAADVPVAGHPFSSDQTIPVDRK